jgi:hypothetical protein
MRLADGLDRDLCPDFMGLSRGKLDEVSIRFEREDLRLDFGRISGLLEAR